MVQWGKIQMGLDKSSNFKVPASSFPKTVTQEKSHICLSLNVLIYKVGVMIYDDKGGGEEAGREKEALVSRAL